MLQIETERDPERLRQVALLLRAENDRLHHRLVELTRQLALARGEDAITALQLELKLLHEKLGRREQALFGDSSEKRKRPEGQEREKPKQTGHGPRQQRALPIVERVHVLDDPDKMCPKCGGGLREWAGQFEESDEIDVVERTFRIVRHQRQKYTCKCSVCIETALGPLKLTAGGRYSIDFGVAVAVGKYLDHMPLARQVRQMSRQGLVIDTQTLWDQLLALYNHLHPTSEAILRSILESPVIMADETRWPLMGKPGATKWYAWSVASETAVAYRILPSRSAQAARELLGDYKGIVACDGYKAYTSLRDTLGREANGPPPFELSHCWTHARRGFRDAEPHYPKAAEMVELIGKLYEVEARARETGADLGALRQRESTPIVDQILLWLNSTVALPKSSLGKAILYTLGIWQGLKMFLSNPAIPIDTNGVERGMRGIALGRKNHYGSRSERGTRVAALFYTLMETAKLAGVDPAAYLSLATRRAIENPGTVTLPSQLSSP